MDCSGSNRHFEAGGIIAIRTVTDICSIAFVDRLIEKGLQNQASYEEEREKGNRYVFLHELLSQTQDRVKIRSELLNILVAGRDTTVSPIFHYS